MTDRVRLAGLEFDLIRQEQLIEQVTDALLRLAATEDSECFLHPERLLTTMTERQASSQKENLEGSISFRREAYEKAILARSAIKIEDKADAGLE